MHTTSHENARHAVERIAPSTWDVDGNAYVVVQRTDLIGGTDDQIAMLMDVLECSELEAWHALHIIREDGEFITSVTADIEDLPLFAA